jgi:hypothetical protein
MDNQQKAYRIFVSTTGGRALLFCVSYPLDAQLSAYGLEFFELMWSHSIPPLPIPYSRQATFKEELITMHQAVATRKGGTDEEQEIVRLVKSAYGIDAVIQFSAVDHMLQKREPPAD